MVYILLLVVLNSSYLSNGFRTMSQIPLHQVRRRRVSFLGNCLHDSCLPRSVVMAERSCFETQACQREQL